MWNIRNYQSNFLGDEVSSFLPMIIEIRQFWLTLIRVRSTLTKTGSPWPNHLRTNNVLSPLNKNSMIGGKKRELSSQCRLPFVDGAWQRREGSHRLHYILIITHSNPDSWCGFGKLPGDEGQRGDRAGGLTHFSLLSGKGEIIKNTSR